MKRLKMSKNNMDENYKDAISLWRLRVRIKRGQLKELKDVSSEKVVAQIIDWMNELRDGGDLGIIDTGKIGKCNKEAVIMSPRCPYCDEEVAWDKFKEIWICDTHGKFDHIEGVSPEIKTDDGQMDHIDRDSLRKIYNNAMGIRYSIKLGNCSFQKDERKRVIAGLDEIMNLINLPNLYKVI
jgi:hypothetical protein